MTTTREIAEFVTDLEYADLSTDTRAELRKRVLDSVGIGVGALGADAVDAVHRTVRTTDRDGNCRLWGRGPDGGTDGDGRAADWDHASPVGAAMHNTTLTRYLDFMDSFLAPGETPHPSDNLGAVIAAGEHVDATGRELLTGLAVAYELQGELAWNAPVRDRGFDHVTHTVISSAAGAASMLELDVEQTCHAVGIAGTAHNALRVTRTGGINEWKGVAAGNAARNGVYAAVLASEGMEGPTNLFEGQKGWQQVVSGGDFSVSFSPGERVHDTMTKKYVAETYAQSAVEAVIDLADRADLSGAEVASIHLDTFAGAKLIIGGGEGSRYEVETKAQADHSLPYMLAAAMLDREMGVDQYDPGRIRREDVQRLLRNVTVEEDPAFTEAFEEGLMPARVTVELDDGTTHVEEREAFEGHPTRSMSWEAVESKFHSTTEDRYDPEHRDRIVDRVRAVEDGDVGDLTGLLW